MELTHIVPDCVPSVWREIRERVQVCIDHDTDDSLIEDVYHFVISQKASLYIAYVDKKIVGFTVLQRVYDMYSGVSKIMVWLCSCDKREYTEECFELIKSRQSLQVVTR